EALSAMLATVRDVITSGPYIETIRRLGPQDHLLTGVNTCFENLDAFLREALTHLAMRQPLEAVGAKKAAALRVAIVVPEILRRTLVERQDDQSRGAAEGRGAQRLAAELAQSRPVHGGIPIEPGP